MKTPKKVNAQSVGKKVNFYELSKESDKVVALRIKQDLENLTLAFRSKDQESECDEQPLLMVYISTRIIITIRLL
jgi:hypothetical protein